MFSEVKMLDGQSRKFSYSEESGQRGLGCAEGAKQNGKGRQVLEMRDGQLEVSANSC